MRGEGEWVEGRRRLGCGEQKSEWREEGDWWKVAGV